MFSLLILLSAGQATKASIPTAEVLRKEISAVKAVREQQPPAAYDEVARVMGHGRATVDKLLKDDRLKTGREFCLASDAYADLFFFEPLQKTYELRLTAALLGDKDARSRLANAWDRLVFSMGHGQRFGSATRPDLLTKEPEPFPISASPSPECLRKAWLSLATLQPQASAKNNEELQAMARDDQADRTNLNRQDGPRHMIEQDRLRRKRTLELCESGGVATAADFTAAGLIFQHGEAPSDYQLAHECAVVATVLGDRMGPSLCSVSYDRFLLSTGHRQRWGTQLGPFQRWRDAASISASEKRTLMVLD